MLQTKTRKAESTAESSLGTSHPRGVLDVSYAILLERPALLEEKLLRTPGVISAEINVFSNRVRVEFDPSTITLDEIRDILAIDGNSWKSKKVRA